MLIRPFPGNTWLVFAPLIRAIGVMGAAGGGLLRKRGSGLRGQGLGRCSWLLGWLVKEKGPGQPRGPSLRHTPCPFPPPRPWLLRSLLCSRCLGQHTSPAPSTAEPTLPFLRAQMSMVFSWFSPWCCSMPFPYTWEPQHGSECSHHWHIQVTQCLGINL